MAYDRAPRKDLLPNIQTSSYVSPNSYNVNFDNDCSCIATNWVPFLTGTERYKPKIAQGPSPNAYYPKLNKKIIGCSSLKYTSPRFKRVDSKPQPAIKSDSYDDSEDGTELSRLKGFLYHCNVPYTIFGYPPTIPGTRHHGYEIFDQYYIIKCCPSDPDTTLGPAFYNVKNHVFCSCYKGCFWSKRTAKRSGSSATDTPGVGTYCLEPQPNPLQEYLNVFRTERDKRACSLRYLDKLLREVRKNNYPAPNEYVITTPKCFKNKKIKLLRRVKREREINIEGRNVSPGPNAYLDPRTALSYLTKPSCVKELNAFLTNAARFPRLKLEKKPAPNRYTIPTFVDEMAKKVSPYAVRKTAFDTSVPKKRYYLPPERPIKCNERCICTEVTAKAEAPVPIKLHPTSPFASRTKRFKNVGCRNRYLASSASYNVTPCVAYVKGQNSFRKAKKYNFLSTEKRFGKLTSFGAVEDKSYIKGFLYNLQSLLSWRKGKIGSFTCAPRFKEKPEITPGPTDYVIHPSFLSAAKNQTFNVTLSGSNPLNTVQEHRLKLKGVIKNHPRRKDSKKRLSCGQIAKLFLEMPNFNEG